MTDHPLTDEICADIKPKRSFGRVLGEIGFCNDMRAAADWQLDRCTEELNQMLYVFELAGKIDEAERMALLNVFMESMRPQQQEENS